MYVKSLVTGLWAIACVMTFNVWASDSLSYSGRLVGTNGAPIPGPVNLRFNLAYTSNPSAVLCSDEILNVTLSHGVFHVKLDFDCGTLSLSDVMAGIPLGSSVAIQTVDISNTTHKTYSYQAMHSVPFSVLAEKAKELGPLNATSAGQVLTWDGSKWRAAVPSTTGGTITSLTAHEGLSGGTITGSGSIGIADGGVTAAKLDSMGANSSGQVLKWNGFEWTAGTDQDSGVAESNIRKFALNNDPLTPAPTCTGHQVLRYILLTDGLECFDLVNDDLDITKSNLAPSQKAVAEALELKQDKIESSLKLTSGTNSVTLGTPASGGDISYTLPLMGTSGQVLKLGASGVLEWGDTGVNGSDIAANSITNSHVADGALSQSKISGLTTDLAAIDTRITNLKTDDVAEGSVNKYFTNDKVLAVPLTGLAPTTGTVNAVDSLLVAFNKIIGNANDVAGAVSILSTNQNSYLLKDGTSVMSGNLVMGGNLITGVGAPSADSDAANKKYVDDQRTWIKSNPDIYYNSGNVGIGTTTPTKEFEVVTAGGSFSATGGGSYLYRYGSLGKGANLNFYSARGTVDTPLIVQNFDQAGYITFRSYDGDEFGTSASIQAIVKPGVVNDSTPGELRFLTTPPGSKAAITRMIINESGYMGIGVDDPSSRLSVDGVFSLKKSLAPTLTSDFGKLYVGADSKLYFLNDLGETTQLGSSNGGTPGDDTITSAKITDGSIVNADINASAGIDATKLGTGAVDNIELSFLSGVTGPIQTQISGIRQVPSGSDTTKYLRGDNTWYTPTTSDIPEGVNKYFTPGLVQSTIMSSYILQPASPLTATDTLVQSLGKLQGQIDGKGQWEKNSTNIYYDYGYVGIGTSNPGVRLDVDGSIRSNRALDNSTSRNLTWQMASDTNNASNNFDSGDPILMLDGGLNSGINTLRIFGNSGRSLNVDVNDGGLFVTGNVGIGTKTPSEKLEVVGNIKATEFLYTSDERLKHDVKTLSKALDKVLRLRGVEFKWNDNNQKTMGFIAQEVEKVLPELVKTDEYSNLKAVQYGNLVGLLVEAIKEEHQSRLKVERKLSSTIDEMQVGMKRLEEENRDLKERLEKIEKYINEKH